MAPKVRSLLSRAFNYLEQGKARQTGTNPDSKSFSKIVKDNFVMAIVNMETGPLGVDKNLISGGL